MTRMRSSGLAAALLAYAALTPACGPADTTATGGGGGTTSTGTGATGGGTATGGTGTSGSTTGGGGTGTGGSGAGGSSTGSGGSEPIKIPACVESCTVAADCAKAGQVFSAAHWACNAGACEYLGCFTTEECQNTFSTDNLTCAPVPGLPYDDCVEPCTVAADCAKAGQVFSAAHWTCNAGACEYLGCFTTEECQNTFSTDNLTCAPVPGLPYQNCVEPCDVVDDCAKAGQVFSADNWTCNAGACEYNGCNLTEECQNTYLDDNLVCH